MRRLLTTSAIVIGALALHTPIAHAANTFTVAGTLGENPASGTQGGPTITPGLTFSDSVTLAMSTVTPVLTSGSEKTGLFTLAPNGSCKGPSNPVGTPGCFTPKFSDQLAALDFSWTGTETDRVSGSWVITDPAGHSVTIAESGTFTAKYGGNALPCATASGAGNSDCFIWDGASNNGSTGSFSDLITFPVDGTKMTVTFNNAEDWDINPTMSLDETGGPTQQAAPVPEPATIALLAIGLLGTVVAAKRKRG